MGARVLSHTHCKPDQIHARTRVLGTHELQCQSATFNDGLKAHMLCLISLLAPRLSITFLNTL